MNKRIFVKIISVALLIVIASVTSLPKAQALPLERRVPTAPLLQDEIENPLGGIGGIVIGVASFPSVGACISGAQKIHASQIVGKVLDGISLITNNASLIAQLTELSATIDTTISACDLAVAAIGASPATSLVSIQRKQSLNDQVMTYKDGLKVIQEQVNTQLRLAKQGFWKALMVYLALNLSKSFAQNFTNKIFAKFNVQKPLAYIETTAALIHDTELILESSSDKKVQLALHDVLNSPLLAGKLNPVAVTLADTAALASGLDPERVDYESPNYYSSMASFGGLNVDPFAQHLSLSGIANSVHAQALGYAKQEFVSNQNLKQPLKCTNFPDQMEQRRKQYDLLKRKTEALKKQVYEVQKSYSASREGEVTDVNYGDVIKANEDYNAAVAEMNDFAESFDSPVMEFCKYASPTNLITKGWEKVAGGVIDNLKDYDSNNLPAVLKLAGQLVGGLVNDFILPNGASNSHVADEQAKNVSGFDGATLTTNPPDVESFEKEEAVFTYVTTGNENEIRLQWALPEGKKVASVKLQGPGVGADAPTKLNAEYVVTITAKSKFQLLRFDDKGVQLNKILEVKVPFPVKNPADVSPDDDSGTANDGSAPDGGPGATTNNDQSVLGALDRVDTVLQTRGEIRPRN